MPFNMLTEKATAGMVAGFLTLALIICSPLPCQAVTIVKSGEVIPRKNTIAVGLVSMEREPAYAWRNLGPGGPLWGCLRISTGRRTSCFL